ncbi:MAG: dihydrolipoyl dehydrogenase, partial [Planctomycetota bacterium]
FPHNSPRASPLQKLFLLIRYYGIIPPLKFTFHKEHQMPEKFDVVVIGSGPGGYSAAIRCAQRNASVAIIEKDLIGGTCLNWGCIPSKALLGSAQLILAARKAADLGVDIPSVSPNWPKIKARKNAIVQNFRKGLTALIAANKIKIYRGKGIITQPGKITIETPAGPQYIEAAKIILATGSQPIQIPAIPFDSRTILTNKEALDLDQIPESMVIIGGGVLGCEMACVYSALGSKITIVEALDRLVPMEDEWVGKLLAREFAQRGIESLTGEKVTAVQPAGNGADITLQNGRKIQAEKILVSVGRQAVCDQQTIDALGLLTEKSTIKVNDKMETSVPGVFAIGDVVGTTYLAHGAFAEAEVAAINATGGSEKMHDYSLVPRAIYTFPEVASVGMGESACKTAGMEYSIGKAFFKANGRSVAHNETTGRIMVIREKSSDKILGITMVGSEVTELLATARILIGTAEKITSISFAHPTVSEVLKEAAEDAFGLSLHNPPG